LVSPSYADGYSLPPFPNLSKRNSILSPEKKASSNPSKDKGTSSTPIPEGIGVFTQTGARIGLQTSYYHYQEPDASVNVRQKGLLFGVTLDGSLTLAHQFFAKSNARFAGGQMDYKSPSGSAKNQPDYLFDFQLLGGRDFAVSNSFGISPFIGVGYRTLYNNAKGYTDFGTIGYRRFNQLGYIPIGVEPRFAIDQDSRLSLSIEYDQVLFGEETSKLGDTGWHNTSQSVPSQVLWNDIHNYQRHGYGIRGNITYETKRWSLGPYFSYWNLGRSNLDRLTALGNDGNQWVSTSADFVEPRNQTEEGGFQVKYKFF
jgi:hypothetical protein